MSFIALRISIKLSQPPFPAIRRCRAILTSFMPMPKTAVDKNHRFVFRQDDVGAAGEFAVVQTEAIAHFVEH